MLNDVKDIQRVSRLHTALMNASAVAVVLMLGVLIGYACAVPQ